MVVTLGQQYNVGEKSTVLSSKSYPNIPTVWIVHSYEDSTNNVDNSTIEPYKNRGLGNQKNVGVYCTISLIAMHGYRTNTEAWVTTLFTEKSERT